jgi:hypothetical protein
MLTDWTVRRSNPFGGEIFRTRPDRPWCVYNGYQVSFPGVKQPRRDFDHPPKSGAEVKERVELYIYPPSWASWTVLGRILRSVMLMTALHFVLGRPVINVLCWRGGGKQIVLIILIITEIDVTSKLCILHFFFRVQ